MRYLSAAKRVLPRAFACTAPALFIALVAGCAKPSVSGDASSSVQQATADGAVLAASARPGGGQPGGGSNSSCDTLVSYFDDKGNVARTETVHTESLVEVRSRQDPKWTDVMVRVDQSERGWVDAAAFRRGYPRCLEAAMKWRRENGKNPCDLVWLRFDDKGAVTEQGTIDIRNTETVDGRPLTVQRVAELPVRFGFITLKEKSQPHTGWFAQQQVLVVLQHVAMCDGAVSAPPVAQPAPPASPPAGGLTLMCEFNGGGAIVVQVDEANRAASVRNSTGQDWVNFRDGQVLAGNPRLEDSVQINASVIKLMRTPIDDGQLDEVNPSTNEDLNDMTRLLAGLGGLLAYSSYASIDRNTGAITSEGMGGIFPHKGVGYCQPWQGARF